MLNTSRPILLPKPFAAGAGGSYIRPIPTASQIGVTNGAASLTDGFPPLTMTPLASGGVPPFGQDVNGILNWLSAISQWYQAGGPVVFNSAFATAIGGYPKGTVLQAAGLAGGFWRSTADNNTSDPDGGSPANWASLFAPVFAGPTFTGTATFSGPAVLNSSLGVNGITNFNSTVNLGNNAGATTAAARSANALVATTAYVDARQGYGASNANSGVFYGGESITVSFNYTPNCDGYMLLTGAAIMSSLPPGSGQLVVGVSGTAYGTEHTPLPMTIPVVVPLTHGVAETFSAGYTADAWGSGTPTTISVRVAGLFVPS